MIDARTVRPGRTGVGVATEEMVRALDGWLADFAAGLPPAAPVHRLNPDSAVPPPCAPAAMAIALPRSRRLWFDQTPRPEPLRAIHLDFSGTDYQRHPAAEWDQIVRLPARLRRDGATAFWGAAFSLPARRVRHCRYLATIHDLAVFTHPHCFSPQFAWLMRRQILNTARVADAIHVPTEFVAADLREHTRFPRERMILSPLGINPFFSPAPQNGSATDPDWPAHLPSPSAARPYLLAPGGRDHRKNVPRLLEAFDALIQRRPRLPHRILLLGPPPRPGLIPASVAPRLCHVGRMTRPQLRALYRHADALLFVSLTEGFGLPVLEAMACGCPVITSTSGSLPTVVGNAARTVDPLHTLSITDEMDALLGQPEKAAALRLAGLERAAQFTWRRTVEPLARWLVQTSDGR